MSDLTSIKIRSDITPDKGYTEHLLARCSLYYVLANLFQPPVADDFELWKEAMVRLGKEAVEKVDFTKKATLGKTFSLLSEKLNSLSFADWTKEYAYCFGHSVRALVPPYELEYGDEHSHRQPQELADIGAFYNAFGLKMGGGIHERMDHVALECEFMHYILLKEVHAGRDKKEDKALICREAAHVFLSEHLGVWVPSFTGRLSKHSSHDFMKILAQFMFDFIVQDCVSLEIVPGHQDLPLRPLTEKEAMDCKGCACS